ncbi:PIN domain nuclease, a component of toxin-antitoxin system (PIN domain) [Desulfonatronum thiosulfatophilum]|uniref:PIN domain nuclease, a component of toxin-antitoxin system (PIN domain) n=1 Tax=Desulfonatronum thiosulfatophilum TaxID=617002 RepID=A0A1G6EB49_9BACT|nr:type II toxin-antitoxin system VapC family toxin [Desulfonatronum thiosulfatophilum]SDB54155.1 PIN domain nuclease, a component of toxin-antitoxin system (PIN domain) [Desulfonatronum thiosulfatophilum]
MSSLLLDTHILLWWLSGHPRLDMPTQKLIASSEAVVSAASVWETAIKFKLGKLSVSPDELLHLTRNSGMRMLPVYAEHAATTAKLPAFHNDPFDRLLIAQAKHEGLQLLTADRLLAAYGDPVRLV